MRWLLWMWPTWLVSMALWMAIIAGVVAMSGCAPSSIIGGPVNADPYLHSEEPSLAAFCAQHPHHGTCP